MPSSVIRRYSYEAPSRTLEITFVSGKVYRYHGVPTETFEEMRLSFSKGEFFNRRIRDHFPFEAVEGKT